MVLSNLAFWSQVAGQIVQLVLHNMLLPIYGPVPQGVYQVSSPMLKKSALAPIERTSTWCSSTSCDKIMVLMVDFGRLKLLCVMAGQMKWFKAHFQLPWASTALNGVPMPIGVGVLQGAAEWRSALCGAVTTTSHGSGSLRGC